MRQLPDIATKPNYPLRICRMKGGLGRKQVVVEGLEVTEFVTVPFGRSLFFITTLTDNIRHLHLIDLHRRLLILFLHHSTKWCSYVDWKKDGVWHAEFFANIPVKPVGYKLTTAADTEKYPERNPKKWRLLARDYDDEPWT